jgi:hypothetical protein
MAQSLTPAPIATRTANEGLNDEREVSESWLRSRYVDAEPRRNT